MTTHKRPCPTTCTTPRVCAATRAQRTRLEKVFKHVCPDCGGTSTKRLTQWTAECACGAWFSPATSPIVEVTA